ncbi:hypothetical protein HPB51_025328 [Rhipicephalus microplus]|uniref:Uncharacterized protein n=1 Tax=Rhipicephalus microplus TaxID=6941 RepID=A0A9J6DDJ0_RHIMP|nr:hypothetical protein HPB51_025328 [Rhipicephalus microplus]
MSYALVDSITTDRRENGGGCEFAKNNYHRVPSLNSITPGEALDDANRSDGVATIAHAGDLGAGALGLTAGAYARQRSGAGVYIYTRRMMRSVAAAHRCMRPCVTRGGFSGRLPVAIEPFVVGASQPRRLGRFLRAHWQSGKAVKRPRFGVNPLRAAPSVRALLRHGVSDALERDFAQVRIVRRRPV